VGFACTGASYLAGVDAERQQLLQLREACGVPVITAAGAVADALNALGVTQIGLVSPYDAELDEASALYWQARGFQVLERVSAFAPSSAFHPIYSLSSDAAQRGIDAISSALQQGGLPSGLQAIVMLGTGMPTLAPIARTPMPVGQPLLSCMFCLAWRCAMALQSRVPDRDSLIEWLNAPGWRARLAAQRAG
jgi:maleate cis-trans isomerase